MMHDDHPHIRLFLSADLVGSTRIKNQLSHQELFEKFHGRMHAVERVRDRHWVVAFTDEDARSAVLESLGISSDDFDWATVIGAFYRDFHSEFSMTLRALRWRCDKIDPRCKPWKAIGDELVYQFPVASRRHLYWVTTAFLVALRTIDNKMASRATPGTDSNLRLKGAAWTAGFPVRNRLVQLPGADDRFDFLGPDIDTGFRIGGCTRPGMLVVSVELAELLGEVAGDLNPLVGRQVGWDSLKGVWNDAPYPVIWVDLPSGYPGAEQELVARDFNAWERLGCKFCEAWQADETAKPPLRQLVPDLRKLREQLPRNLGLVDPYILSDPEADDDVPPEHQAIRTLQQWVEQYQADVGKQGDDRAGDERTRPDELLRQQVREMLSTNDDATSG